MVRVLFLGTPDFAVPSLRRLLDSSEIEIAGVITQPDRPAGRRLRPTAPPVKRTALEHGLPLLQPNRIRGDQAAHEFARRLRPDVMAVVAFGQILPPSFFEIPPHGALNVHASLLPRYRGAAPVAYALLNGDRRSGVTIMKIDAGMDTGDILAAREVEVGPDTTAGELSEKLANLGADLLAGMIPPWVRGEIEAEPQDDSMADYAPLLDKEAAWVDWRKPPEAVHNQIRAFNPWPVARTRFRGEPIKLWAAGNPRSDAGVSVPPGAVVDVSEAGIRVAAADGGTLDLLELQPPSRRRMSARDFANGRQVEPGERFDGRSG